MSLLLFLEADVEAHELVEQFDVVWRQVTKKVPLVYHGSKEVQFSVFLPVGNLRVFVRLSVGSRGGIGEEVIVIDPSAPIVADRLVVRCYDGDVGGGGALLPLAELRQQIRRAPGRKREYALQICEGAMWDFVDHIKAHPLSPRRLRRIQSTSESFRALTGGLPSQGRYGGRTSRPH